MTDSNPNLKRIARVYLYHQIGLTVSEISNTLGISADTAVRDLDKAFRIHGELEEPADSPEQTVHEIPTGYKPTTPISLRKPPIHWYFKSCPRCSGDISFTGDALDCAQCGYHRETERSA